jgi:hypothetical protein
LFVKLHKHELFEPFLDVVGLHATQVLFSAQTEHPAEEQLFVKFAGNVTFTVTVVLDFVPFVLLVLLPFVIFVLLGGIVLF